MGREALCGGTQHWRVERLYLQVRVSPEVFLSVVSLGNIVGVEHPPPQLSVQPLHKLLTTCSQAACKFAHDCCEKSRQLEQL